MDMTQVDQVRSIAAEAAMLAVTGATSPADAQDRLKSRHSAANARYALAVGTGARRRNQIFRKPGADRH